MSKQVGDNGIDFVQLVDTAVKRIERRAEKRKDIEGVSWGFSDLDNVTDGLRPPSLIIIGGRPSMGKTAFALNVMRTVALKQKLPVAYFSYGESAALTVGRVLSMGAKLKASDLRVGTLSGGDRKRMNEEAETLKSAPMVFDDTCSSFETFAQICALLKNRPEGLFLIVVDNCHEFSDLQTQSKMSIRLRFLAHQLNVAIIALSPVTRDLEERDDKRPTLSDLRNGIGLEDNGANLVLFLYRSVYYKPNSKSRNKAELCVAKNDAGALYTIELSFDSETSIFSDYEYNRQR